MPAIITSKRRSHLNRRAMEKRVQITDNDIRDIFEPLARHAQLTTRQLVAFGTRNPIITKARLGELWHGTAGQRSHWLHRLNEDVLFANHLSVEDMHRLGSEAEALLVMSGVISADDWVAASRIGGKSTSPSRVIRLAHDHMTSDIVLDIEIGARDAGVPFRSHLNMLRAAPEATRSQARPLKMPVRVDSTHTWVEPDALFAVGDRVYALEADRGTESIQTVISHKIRAYREAVAGCMIDTQWGVENLTVLFATTTVVRMKNMMAALARIARNGRSTMFAFRAEAGFGDFLRTPAPTGRLLTAQWARVGHGDLVLSAPNAQS